jgi:hypothetical protein
MLREALHKPNFHNFQNWVNEKMFINTENSAALAWKLFSVTKSTEDKETIADQTMQILVAHCLNSIENFNNSILYNDSLAGSHGKC